MSSLTGHLAELRQRLLIIVGTMLLGAGVCYVFKNQMQDVLLWPLQQSGAAGSLIFTGATDAFFIHLKTAIFVGIGVAIPVICWQIWGFIGPGLYLKEKKTAIPFVLGTPLLFYTGVTFAYFTVLPLALGFFFNFQTADVTALPALIPYFDFVLKMLLAFGFAFTLPIILLLCVRLGWVKVERLAASRRIVFVAVFIAAAIMTPPDPISQLILAVPLYLLYESAIFLARCFGKDTTKTVA